MSKARSVKNDDVDLEHPRQQRRAEGRGRARGGRAARRARGARGRGSRRPPRGRGCPSGPRPSAGRAGPPAGGRRRRRSPRREDHDGQPDPRVQPGRAGPAPAAGPRRPTNMPTAFTSWSRTIEPSMVARGRPRPAAEPLRARELARPRGDDDGDGEAHHHRLERLDLGHERRDRGCSSARQRPAMAKTEARLTAAATVTQSGLACGHRARRGPPVHVVDGPRAATTSTPRPAARMGHGVAPGGRDRRRLDGRRASSGSSTTREATSVTAESRSPDRRRRQPVAPRGAARAPGRRTRRHAR